MPTPFVFPNRAQRRAQIAMMNRKPKPKRKRTYRANQKADARNLTAGQSKLEQLLERGLARTILIPEPTGRD